VRHSRQGVAALILVMVGLAAGLSGCSTPGGVGGVMSPTAPGKVTVRYGPYTIPAATPTRMGMLQNNFAFNVEKPCTNCYITSMQAGLLTADGQSANVDKGLWLHHMVMMDTSKADLCGWPLGQRFFSSGNERTPVNAGGPYAYPQTGAPNWTLIYDLMNMNAQAKQVYITVEFGYSPISTPNVRPITPLWLDVAGCISGSAVPARPGQVFTLRSTPVVSQNVGKLIGIGGHIHDGGINLLVKKNGQVICDSRATYGGTPEYIEGPTSLEMPGMAHLSQMSRCQGPREAPVTSIARGDSFVIEANYDMTPTGPGGGHDHGGGGGTAPAPHPVMGIAIGYLDIGAGA
jgi:hypothetical protein